jgi:transposase
MTYIVKKTIRGKTYYYEYESYRVDGKVKHRYVRYLGKSKDLRKKDDMPTINDLEVLTSLDYGSVAALHTLADRMRLSQTVYESTAKSAGAHIGKLVEIMVINRCLAPVSRNRLAEWYNKTALPIFLDIPAEKVHTQLFYNAMDYLDDDSILAIQKKLFTRINKLYGIDTSKLFYDLTSTYFEGNKCPLAKYGYSRDHRPDKPQINIGLTVAKDGMPIMHNVYEGSTQDVTTVQDASTQLKSEFELESPVIVVDRGMISAENLDTIRGLGFHYIIARKMLTTESATIQSISDDKYETVLLDNYSEQREIGVTERFVNKSRWIICHNIRKSEDDKVFRQSMIDKTMNALEKIRKKCGKGKLKKKEEVYHRTHTVLEKYDTEPFFDIQINSRGAPRLKFEFLEDNVEKAQRLDGKFILETSDPTLTPGEVVQAYHDRDVVEKFFQMLKDIVEIRPMHVYTERHVKAHVFVCVLAVMMLSLIRKILKESGKETTSIKALEILDGIKRVEFSQKDGTGTIVRTTKINGQQREIISILNVAPIGLGNY